MTNTAVLTVGLILSGGLALNITRALFVAAVKKQLHFWV